MTDKEKDDWLKDAVAAIGVITAQYDVEVIRNYEIAPLVDTRTRQTMGFGVDLKLNTSYDYDEAMLTGWKKMLKAYDWYLRVKRNQLHVTFMVRYKED